MRRIPHSKPADILTNLHILSTMRGNSAKTEIIEGILVLECEKGNRRTVRVDNYFEIMVARAKQEAERKEKERINEEMKDPRWKICPNGHCFENIRVNVKSGC